jgi:hypothetical protein
MTHVVTGFVVNVAAAEKIKALHPKLRFTALDEGMVLFPLPEHLLEEIVSLPEREPTPKFEHLSAGLTKLLREISAISTLMYFETEYFGGDGEQSAIVFAQGNVILGPTRDNIGPINEGLRLLGVRRRPDRHDEFDTVGLGRRRSSEDWFAA